MVQHCRKGPNIWTNLLFTLSREVFFRWKSVILKLPLNHRPMFSLFVPKNPKRILCVKKSYLHTKSTNKQEKSLSRCQWEMINFIKRYSCERISQEGLFSAGRSEKNDLSSQHTLKRLQKPSFGMLKRRSLKVLSRQFPTQFLMSLRSISKHR